MAASSNGGNSSDVSSWVGIDLGTTNTVLAVFKNKSVQVLYSSDSGGSTVTKSCVYFEEETDQILVGNPAAPKRFSKPQNTIYDAKRLMGVPYLSGLAVNERVHKFKKHVQFSVISNPDDGFACFELQHNGKRLMQRPQDIGAKLLMKMRALLEERENGCSRASLRKEFRRAVISVPANFSQEQRLATDEAGKMAGFEEIQFITEPSAAAYAYAFEHKRHDGYKILVYDFGGGTFDVSILDVRNSEFHVLQTDGDPWLGGNDLDQALANHCAERIKAIYGKDCLNNPRRRHQLLGRCVLLKESLSSLQKDGIYLDFMDDELTVTRDQFESVCLPLLEKSIKITERALAAKKLTPKHIDEVLLVGGTSAIPLVRDLLEDLGFRRDQLNQSVNAMEVVAKGAAILGVQICERSKEQIPSMKLLEAVPLSLGICHLNDCFTPIILRNQKYPCKMSETYVTMENDQHSMEFKIYEGERKVASANRHLGTFTLRNLSKGAAGKVSVNLTMEIDRNGILHAVAEHNLNTASWKISYKVNKAGHQSVEELLKDAEQYIREDMELERCEKQASDLQEAICQARYECDNPQILEACDACERWMADNKKASAQTLKQKTTNFLKSPGAMRIGKKNAAGVRGGKRRSKSKLSEAAPTEKRRYSQRISSLASPSCSSSTALVASPQTPVPRTAPQIASPATPPRRGVAAVPNSLSLKNIPANQQTPDSFVEKWHSIQKKLDNRSNSAKVAPGK